MTIPLSEIWTTPTPESLIGQTALFRERPTTNVTDIGDVSLDSETSVEYDGFYYPDMDVVVDPETLVIPDMNETDEPKDDLWPHYVSLARSAYRQNSAPSRPGQGRFRGTAPKNGSFAVLREDRLTHSEALWVVEAGGIKVGDVTWWIPTYNVSGTLDAEITSIRFIAARAYKFACESIKWRGWSRLSGDIITAHRLVAVAFSSRTKPMSALDIPLEGDAVRSARILSCFFDIEINPENLQDGTTIVIS